MCDVCVINAVKERMLSRRDFFRATAAVGAAATVGGTLEKIHDTYRAIVVDFSEAALVDSTAIQTIGALVATARGRGVSVVLTGVSPTLQRQFEGHGLRPPAVPFEPTLARGGGPEVGGIEAALEAGVAAVKDVLGA